MTDLDFDLLKKEVKSFCSDLDLSTYQESILTALILNNGLSVAEISQRSQVPRPKVYENLKALQEKGFVQETTNSSVKKYTSLDLSVITRKVDNSFYEKILSLQEKAENLKPRLDKVKKTEDDALWVLNCNGKTDLLRKFADHVLTAKKTILLSLNSLESLNPALVREMKNAARNGLKVKVFTNSKNEERVNELKKHDCEVLVSNHALPEFLFVDETLLLKGSNNYQALIKVNQNGLATSFKSLLSSAWNKHAAKERETRRLAPPIQACRQPRRAAWEEKYLVDLWA